MPSIHDETNGTGRVLKLPNTLASWPWPRFINPHYEECKGESSGWAESFRAFGPKAQAAFNRCDFNLLASFGYASLDRAGNRVGCDLMNLFFVFDEWSDVSTAAETRIQADVIMDSLRDPCKPRPAGEWVGGALTRSFWLNAIKIATVTAQKRFVDAFQHYTDAVVQQALDRDRGDLRDIQGYFEARRETIGAKPSFAINQIHLDLPDHIVESPIITRLADLSTDMIIIGNDIYSYNVEQSRGDDGHNLVTVVMAELNLGVQEALDWIGRLHDELAAEFIVEYARVPELFTESEVANAEIRFYVDALGNWVRANDQWSFESQRYFGTDGMRILKERTVTLLPKRDGIALGE
ncbi:hypothetical protein diail_1677 [Diaporthe ilicicola]|nr:hypothetical protein diail_1677 [Diaporthe ilicicola]